MTTLQSSNPSSSTFVQELRQEAFPNPQATFKTLPATIYPGLPPPAHFGPEVLIIGLLCSLPHSWPAPFEAGTE